jgi:hypothetical protein
MVKQHHQQEETPMFAKALPGSLHSRMTTLRVQLTSGVMALKLTQPLLAATVSFLTKLSKLAREEPLVLNVQKPVSSL